MDNDITLAGDKKQTDAAALCVDVKLAIPRKQIAYLICSAIEGGIAYWCPRQAFKYKKPEKWEPIMDAGDEKPEEWPCYDYPLLAGGAVTFKADKDAPVRVCVLNLETIAKGLQLMAEKYPRHFGDFMNESGDATTGDVFVQLCVFGDVVYG